MERGFAAVAMDRRSDGSGVEPARGPSAESPGHHERQSPGIRCAAPEIFERELLFPFLLDPHTL